MDTHMFVKMYKDLVHIFCPGNILQNCNVISHRILKLMPSTDLIQHSPVLTVLVYVCAHLVFSWVGLYSHFHNQDAEQFHPICHTPLLAPCLNLGNH